MSLADEKAAARRDARERRAQAAAAPADAARRAADAFLRAVPVPEGAWVALYRPIRTELDPLPLARALEGRGTRLCWPVVVGEAQPLVFRARRTDEAFVPGAFGAAIPPEDAPVVEPALVLVPLLAFDRRGKRLGYGGGFYDRTLATLPHTRAWGFAYAAQEVDAVPVEPTDAPLAGVVTEAGVVVAD